VRRKNTFAPSTAMPPRPAFRVAADLSGGGAVEESDVEFTRRRMGRS
jgi:hypothetical protein